MFHPLMKPHHVHPQLDRVAVVQHGRPRDRRPVQEKILEFGHSRLGQQLREHLVRDRNALEFEPRQTPNFGQLH